MAIEMKKISVDTLAKGMYVSRLDRPWIETPFPLQGFFVRDLGDIDLLRRYCRHVYIDVGRSVRPEPEAAPVPLVKPVQASAANKPKAPVYSTTASVRDEVASSGKLHQQIHASVAQVYESIRSGTTAGLAETRQVASSMVDSVIRNPDAMVWLSRMREKDGYSYAHSVRCSIWAIVFGRYLGLSKEALDSLALGCLLMDVGKAKISSELLNKRGVLSAGERAELERHVQYSLDILAGSPLLTDQLYTIVAQHHERYDGSGYPNRLAGSAIAPMAKIAGIVDAYDAMTSPRLHAQALTSVEAVSRLYELRNKEFQSRLVEEFIQAIGVYPTGTLVRLSSEEIGVVIEQNQVRRLRPKILLLLDHQKKPLRTPATLDLAAVSHDFRGEPLKIASSLLPGTYDLHPEQWQLNVA